MFACAPPKGASEFTTMRPIPALPVARLHQHWGHLTQASPLTTAWCRVSSPQQQRRNGRAPWVLLVVTLCSLVAVAVWRPQSPCMTQNDRERFTQAAVSSLDKMAAQARSLHCRQQARSCAAGTTDYGRGYRNLHVQHAVQQHADADLRGPRRTSSR